MRLRAEAKSPRKVSIPISHVLGLFLFIYLFFIFSFYGIAISKEKFHSDIWVINWEIFSLYSKGAEFVNDRWCQWCPARLVCEGNPLLTCGFSSQASEIRTFYVSLCYPERAIVQTVKLLVIWDVITFMWRRNEEWNNNIFHKICRRFCYVLLCHSAL